MNIMNQQVLKLLFSPNKSMVKSTAATIQRRSIALVAHHHYIVRRPGKPILTSRFTSRSSSFFPTEQCNYISPSAPLSRDGLHNFIKRSYSPVIWVIINGWQPEVNHNCWQCFARRE